MQWHLNYDSFNRKVYKMAKFTIVTNRRLYKDDLARIPLEVSYRLYQNQVFLYVTDYHSNNFEPIEFRLIE